MYLLEQRIYAGVEYRKDRDGVAVLVWMKPKEAYELYETLKQGKQQDAGALV